MSEQNQKKVDEKFSLNDVGVLNELFEVVLYDVLRRYKMVAEHSLKKEEAIAMDKQSAAFLSAVLAGKNDQFVPKPYWTGDPLAGYLKIILKDRFEAVGVSADDLKDSRGILQAAAFEFICDSYMLIKSASGDSSAKRFQLEGKRLCKMWAERMLGLRESDPIDLRRG